MRTHMHSRVRTGLGIVLGIVAVAVVTVVTQGAPPKPHRRPVRRVRAKLPPKRLPGKKLPPRRIVRPGGILPRKVVVGRPTTVVHTTTAVPSGESADASAAAAGPVMADNARQAPATSFSNAPACKVMRVAADNSVMVMIGGKEVSVRLMGLTSTVPPWVDAGAKKRIHEWLANLLKGESVYVKYDSAAAAGKTRAYLYRAPDGLFVNLEMIRQGKALASTRYVGDHQMSFSLYQARARTNAKGVWKRPPAMKTSK